MMSFKMPQFISKKSSSKNVEDRAKYLAKYKEWYDQEITQDWIEGFKARIESRMLEEEKSKPSTEFEFNHHLIANRAERLILRSLIKEMNYKV
jgi:hypothetical protein